jgi:mono/diheme cytochrome c family protein
MIILSGGFASRAVAPWRLAAQSAVAVSGVELPDAIEVRETIDTYCVACHNPRARVAGLDLESVDFSHPVEDPHTWEKVIAKLRAGSMPPAGSPRPDPETYARLAASFERDVDREWARNPAPGRVGAVHRLNRVEYNNAVRDLLALDVDVTGLLPGDETADGSFDNFADSLTISTAHLERYMSVARQVTRLATGLPPVSPGFDRFEIPLHVLQDDRQGEGLPLGSRGGMAVTYPFPVDGEYVIMVELQRQYQGYLKGMGWPQDLDVRIDGELVGRFSVGGEAEGRPAASSYAGAGEVGFAGDPEWEEYMQLTGDQGLEVRVRVTAGTHVVSASFVREMWEPEGLPQPLQRGRVIGNEQVYMEYANVHSVEVGGPYGEVDAGSATPSREAIFVCEPPAGADPSSERGSERACAETILERMARLAYRRPATENDVRTLLEFFNAGRGEGGSFEAGIQLALERMLVDPDFLLRVYRDPTGAEEGDAVYALGDIELASRLSFFLWSSIPDDRLLTLAEEGRLTDPEVLRTEVRRMFDDPRAIDALVGDFAGQWLNLRRIDEVVVDPNIYPNYDLSLIQGFREETELFVASTIREDRSVTELIDADYSYLNERLARHYEVPGVYGSHFRRVVLPNRDQRGGLLGHGSLLVTSSYPDRTSPVLRGKWLMDNIMGLPVPPPPPEVDTTLEETPASASQNIRERLAAHRTNPTCSSCHSVIDPLGFSLENFDVMGSWRTTDESGRPVDASGTTVAGESIDGLAGLRTLLVNDPERFPRTVTAKLMAYALGRRVEYYDQPAIRQIVRNAADEDYSWSSIIAGIVQSPAFRTRTAEPVPDGTRIVPDE